VAVLRPGARRNRVICSNPRDFDQPTGLWTLELAANVAYAQGLTARRVSAETIRATLARMGLPRRTLAT
jgi:hypothetical protein